MHYLSPAARGEEASDSLEPKPSSLGASGYYAMTRTSLGLMLSLLVSLVLKANPPEGFMESLEEEDSED